MTNPFIGEIRAFSFGFAPTGWLQCNGQLLPINQYQALFSLLGTTFGGNGVQTFALPDLRGRIASGTSGSSPMGLIQGTESVTLLTQQLPQHNHLVLAAANGSANFSADPGPTVVLGSGSQTTSGTPAVTVYSNATPNLQLAPLSSNGSSVPHENRMPSLVMNYCIALVGIFPSRG